MLHFTITVMVSKKKKRTFTPETVYTYTLTLSLPLSPLSSNWNMEVHVKKEIIVKFIDTQKVYHITHLSVLLISILLDLPSYFWSSKLLDLAAAQGKMENADRILDWLQMFEI